VGGIGGIVDMTNGCADVTLLTKLIKMSAKLRHRGLMTKAIYLVPMIAVTLSSVARILHPKC
jgi:hypothetical protein